MKNNDNDRLLAHKRRIDAERQEQARTRAAQARLRAITPGTATPLSVMQPARSLDTGWYWSAR